MAASGDRSGGFGVGPSPHDEVVLCAVEVPEAIGDRAAVDPLLARLSDRRYNARARTARALLGSLDAPRARLAPMQAVKDREPEVRRALHGDARGDER
ncbi:hypothetical protein L21_2320 [Methanoculleus chikugoensis]|uniref:HEAT repeat n=1 Tax=Methanoculleus chikugoensis TaxID=118126 RepID=A0A1M4MNI4_9EURY|nr:hypothetical protein [Methanoculleus chikugoensis]SCL76390.1 hypothetical protein L21_2320 [Methanoculleus chikugoensis]